MVVIKNKESNTLISGTSGDDSIQNGGYWYENGVEKSHYVEDVTINAGKGNDSIRNYGSEVIINAGAGNDSIYSDYRATIYGGDGNDTINSDAGYLDGCAGDDIIYLPWGVFYSTSIVGGTGNDTIYDYITKGIDRKQLFKYESGDGNDVIYGFSEKDMLQIGDGTESYSIVKSGNDVIVKVGDGAITFKNIFATTDSLNINSDNIEIEERKSFTLTAKNDYIQNIRDNATIDGGNGNDTIYSEGDNSFLSGGAGDDSIRNGSNNRYGGSSVEINGGAGNDYIYSRGKNSTILGGDGNDTISSEGGTIDGGNGNDYIDNDTSYAIINGGAGNDSIMNWNDDFGSNSSISGGVGNDSIKNLGLSVTIEGGAGNDSIFNACDQYNGTTYYDDSDGANVIFKYNTGDGNDIIYGFRADSTLSICGGSYSTKKSGSDIIVTVGTGKISLIGAASLSSVNIKGTKTSTETNSWKLNGTTATYGTSKKTLVTVSGVKSTSGLSISGKVVTVSKSALNASKITISDGYTLKLADDVTKTTTKKAWSLSGTTAKYNQTTTAGYKLANNVITYTKKATKTLATVSGVKSTSGLSISGKVVTVSKSALNASKITISNGYTLKLADDVTKTTTKKAWSLSGTTAKYNQTTTAGYKLANNVITYTKKATKTLATVNGAKSKSGLSVSKNTITLKNTALNKKVTISGGYEFDFAADYGKATITGSKNADKITARGKKISINGGKGNDLIKILGSGTVNGGDGADIFYLKPNVANVIADYAEEDKISLASGSAEIEKSGDDVIFNGKITVKGGADKVISYVDAGGKNTYQEEQSDEIILSKSYKKDSYTLSDGQLTLDASAVTHDLTITGNKESNKIVGTSQDDIINGDKGADTILGGAGNDSLIGGAGNDCLSGGAGDDSLWGGAGTDTLIGGDGDDVFIYKKGDGKVIIDDFDDNLDRILVLSGKVGNPKAGKDVTFAVEDGQIIVKNGANKYIPIYYVDFENAVKQYRPDN